MAYRPIQPAASLYKVLLEHSLAHYFSTVCAAFALQQRFSSCGKVHMTYKV